MDPEELQRKIGFYRDITIQHNLIGTDTFYPSRSAFFSPSKVADFWRVFLENRKKPYLSMYINIPYCLSRCKFCMYNSKVLSREEELDYHTNYLLDAISFFSPVFEDYVFSTLHIGGGTPNLLREALLTNVLDEVGKAFDFMENASRAIEITPNNISEKQLDIMMEKGINRVSIGVQSLTPNAMNTASRVFVPKDRIVELVKNLRRRGVEEINVDLMGGLPGEAPAEFREGFTEIAKLGVSTINIYFLRLENTRYPPETIREYSILNREEYTMELLDSVADVAREYRYRNSSSDPYVVCQKFYHQDFSYNLKPHITSWDPEHMNSCLGLGINSASHILDRATLTDAGPNGAGIHNISKALSGKLEFPRTLFQVYAFREIDRMRNYVLKELYGNGRVYFRDFSKHFQKDIMDVFGDEISTLEATGKAEVENDCFILHAGGVVERAVYMKFFYDQKALEELAGKRPKDYFVTS